MAKSRRGGEQSDGREYFTGPDDAHSIEKWGWPDMGDDPVDIVAAMRLRRRFEAAHPEEPRIQIEDLVEPLNGAYGWLFDMDYAEQAGWVREEYARAEAEGRDVIPEAAIPEPEVSPEQPEV